ncbi:hypothetical protein BACPU_02100 [Bacillus pumilus]|nr:hypothetical protein BACPU_02100 [Bacillus pumilus]
MKLKKIKTLGGSIIKSFYNDIFIKKFYYSWAILHFNHFTFT